MERVKPDQLMSAGEKHLYNSRMQSYKDSDSPLYEFWIDRRPNDTNTVHTPKWKLRITSRVIGRTEREEKRIVINGKSDARNGDYGLIAEAERLE